MCQNALRPRWHFPMEFRLLTYHHCLDCMYVSLVSLPFLCEQTVLEIKTHSKMLGECTVRKGGGEAGSETRNELRALWSYSKLHSAAVSSKSSSCPTKLLFPNLLFIFKCIPLQNIILFSLFGRTAWDLSSPTRDWTCAWWWNCWILTTRPPGNSPKHHS